MAIQNPLLRLFGGSSERPPVASFQVVANLCAVDGATNAELEAAADRALEILTERAAGTALGPVVGCNFEAGSVEIEFTVEASSPTELHRKIGEAFRRLEEEGSFKYHDSSTARLDPRQDEPKRKMVPA